MKKRIICIHKNETDLSKETAQILKQKLESSGFCVVDTLSDDTELLVCIGGDGATLSAIYENNFPKVPIIGINTGHLGFFQEIRRDQLDDFIFNYKENKYVLQPTTAVQAKVIIGDKEIIHKGFNEIVIRGSYTCSAHFNISIGDSFIERFSGDGILVATPAGSTAYNYSLGGSIVDPRVKLLQVTPIAPMNTIAYRSFTSSILLPPDLSIGILPEYTRDNFTYVIKDGIEVCHENVDKIKVEFSETVVNILRFETYDFWNKVKTKFL